MMAAVRSPVMSSTPKPTSGEYPSYASMYIDLLPDDGQLHSAADHP